MDLEYVYIATIEYEETDENLQKLCDLITFMKLKPSFGYGPITSTRLRQMSRYTGGTLLLFNTKTKRLASVAKTIVITAVETGDFAGKNTFYKELYTYLYKFCE